MNRHLTGNGSIPFVKLVVSLWVSVRPFILSKVSLNASSDKDLHILPIHFHLKLARVSFSALLAKA